MIYPKHFVMAPEGDESSSGGAPDAAAVAAEAARAAAAAKSRVVNPDDHDRALADMHKYKTEAATAKAEKAALEAAREADKVAKLKEQGEWKTIAEQKEKEAIDAKAEAKRITESFLGNQKFNAVKAACEKLGLLPGAMSDLELIDLKDIGIETTSTGRVHVLGADKFAETLKTRKGHWFTDPKAPRVNSDGTRVLDSSGGGAITPRDLLTAETEGKKSGDMSKYKTLFQQYQEQRTRRA